MLRRLFRLLSPVVILCTGFAAAGRVHAAGRFAAPAGVTVDRYGNVYVADSGDGRVFKLAPNGATLRSWTNHGTGFVGGSPTGIGVDRYGNVYVTDSENGTVIKYGPRGGFASQWARAGDGEFTAPQGLSIGRRGSVFVANSNNDSIEKLTPRGRILNVWPVSNDSGTAEAPQWVSVGADGSMYSTVEVDCAYYWGGYAIEKRASDGTLLTTWSYDDTLTGIAVGGRGNIFAVDQDLATIIKLAPDGQELSRWQLPSNSDLTAPTGIAVDGRGNVYVTDTYGARVIKLSPTGQVL